MTTETLNLVDLDPTDKDIADLDDGGLTDVIVADLDDWFEDDDYSARDDRYDGDGIPSWSAWA